MQNSRKIRYQPSYCRRFHCRNRMALVLLKSTGKMELQPNFNWVGGNTRCDVRRVSEMCILFAYSWKNEKPHIKFSFVYNRTIFAMLQDTAQEKSRVKIIFSFYVLCTIYVIVNADMHAHWKHVFDALYVFVALEIGHNSLFSVHWNKMENQWFGVSFFYQYWTVPNPWLTFRQLLVIKIGGNRSGSWILLEYCISETDFKKR